MRIAVRPVSAFAALQMSDRFNVAEVIDERNTPFRGIEATSRECKRIKVQPVNKPCAVGIQKRAACLSNPMVNR